MKKFLSLVLALVMTMSLVTVSAGAAFTDSSSIDYKEAVEVMKAVKVIDGYTDGSFKPGNTLTRGAAAKIICNMVLGPTTAEALVATAAPYSDVPADSTFAGYIAYCKNEGIVSGYADGSFKPGNTLTGFAFLKMLLGALGYDQTLEGYVGENWSISVAKQAQNIGLTDGNKGFVGTKAVTREEACLYALNTLLARPVKYASKGTSIVINGAEIVTGASAVDYKYNDNGNMCYYNDLFDTDLVVDNVIDDFGRSAKSWTYDGNDVGTFTEKADYVFTEKTSESQMAAALKGVKADVYKVSADVKPTTAVTVDGITFPTTQSTAKTLADLTANGKQVEIFVNSKNEISNIVEITYAVAKVDTVTTNSKGDVTYGLKSVNGATLSLKDYNDDDVRDDNFVADFTMAKKDYVTYAVSLDAQTVYVYPTTTVTGVVSAMKSADYVTVDGVKTPLAALAGGATLSVKTSEQDLYVDQFGAVVWGTDVDKTSDVVYLTKGWDSTGSYNETTHMAQIVTVEGKVIELETDKLYNDRGVYTYYVDGDDVAWLTNANNGVDAYKVDTSVALKTSTPKVAAAETTSYYYFDTDVAFVNMKSSGSKLKVTVATGVQAVSTASLAGSYMVLDDTNSVTAMFIPAQAEAVVDKDDVLFVASTSKQGEKLDADNKKGDLYSFYQAGEKKTEIVSGISSVGFYTYSIDEATGRYSLTAETSGVYSVSVDCNAGKVYAVQKDTFVTFPTAQNLKDAKLAADCTFYDTTDYEIDSLAKLVAVIENNDDCDGLDLWAIYDSKKEVITCVYIADYTSSFAPAP